MLSADDRPGNWVRLHPAAHSIVVRSYYQLAISAQNDPTVPVTLAIEPLDGAPRPRRSPTWSSPSDSAKPLGSSAS